MRGLLARLDYKWQVLIVIATGTFMVILNTTMINIALPRIITVFGAGVEEAQLVLTGFMLAMAIVMPATPFLSQTVGSKRLYVFTLGMFTFGSMLCGLAWSMETLVLARVLQGLGGGMIQPLGMAILFRETPPEQRGTIMSIWAMPVMLGPILGPSLGGYLVEYVDWRWVFYINVPVGAVGMLLGLLLMRETPITRGLSFDAVGFGLAAVCSTAALLGLSEAPDKGWSDTGVTLRLLLAAVTLAAFIWWQLRTRHPLLNLRLFAIPAFSLGAMLNFVTATALFGAVFLLPVFLQNVRGLGAMETGMLMLPQALTMAVFITLSGRLYDRVGARPLVLGGLLGLAAATWLLSRLDVTTPDNTLRLVLMLRGAAMGLTMMPASTAWLAAAPLNQTATASALNNVLRQLFGSFGTAMFASILDTRIDFHYATLAMFAHPDMPAVARLLAQSQQFALAHGLSLHQATVMTTSQLAGQVRLAATVRGFDDCFLIAAVACLLGLIPAFFMRRAASAAASRPAPRPADEPRTVMAPAPPATRA